MLSNDQKKLEKYLQARLGVDWPTYLQRFADTKPLKLWETSLYQRSLCPEEVECNISLLKNLSSKYKLKRIEPLPKLVAGFKKKVTKETVEKLNYIEPNFLGLGFLLHRKIIDIMLSLCPEDFQPIPVTLISLNKNVEPFEIKDFFAVNVLKCVDAVDQRRSVVEWSSNRVAHIRNLHYKQNPWQDGCMKYLENQQAAYAYYQLEKPCLIAIDALSGAIIWHPELARRIPHGPKEFFVKDIECKIFCPYSA